jgi:hypothetical protein
VRCGLSCWSDAGLRVLARRMCRGSMAEQAHASHDLTLSSGVNWCRRCGAYAIRIPRALRLHCRGAPASEAAANVKRRLLRGLPPTTAAIHVAAAKQYAETEEARRSATAATLPPGAATAARAAPAASSTTDDAPYRCYACGPSVSALHHRAVENEVPSAPPSWSKAWMRSGAATETGSGAAQWPPAADHSGQASGIAGLNDDAMNQVEKARLSSRYRALDARVRHLGRRVDEQSFCRGQSAPPAVVRKNESGHESRSRSFARRRIRGKQTLAAASSSPRPSSHHHHHHGAPPFIATPCPSWCEPAPSDGWVARLVVSRVAAPAPCIRCSGLTRASCRGCAAALCVSCTKQRRWCKEG